MIRASLIALSLFAAACAPAETPPPEQPPEAAMPQTREEATAQDTCGASAYRSLVGANIAAVTLPADSNIRVVQPDSVITQDFRPDRINIITDANGVMTSLECF